MNRENKKKEFEKGVQNLSVDHVYVKRFLPARSADVKLFRRAPAATTATIARTAFAAFMLI